MQKINNTLLAAILVCCFLAAPAIGADFTVTVTNTTHGSYFTPLLISGHDSPNSLFEAGAPATAALQAMAEGGSIADLSARLGGADADTVENPAGGLLGPGQSTSADLNTDATGNIYLSLVGMILPTNDGFVGLDSLMIPNEAGTYTYMLNAYDAGTEANNELVAADGGIPGTPGMPNPPPVGLTDSGGTGMTNMENNTTVHIHRGVLGDTNPAGGPSDIDAREYRWLNPVAKLVITVR